MNNTTGTPRPDRPTRLALACADFAQRWFPDAWVFAALGVVLVALAAI